MEAKFNRLTKQKAFNGMMRGNQAQISFTLPPELLSKVNATAEKLSISRSAFIKIAITRAIEAESN